MRWLALLFLAGLMTSGCGSAEETNPGQSTSLDAVDSAVEPNIDEASVRRVETLRTPGGRYALLAARSRSGGLCLADQIRDNAEPGMSAQSLFSCEVPGQLWPFVNFGGETMRTADWAVIAGIVRNADRVTVRLADGTTKEASIGAAFAGEWRPFTFAARTAPLPRAVSAGTTTVDVGAHIQAPCPGRDDDPCLPGDPADRSWSDSVDASLAPERRLEEAEAQRTRKIIAADGLLDKLLAGRAHTYERIGLWFDCDNRRIGTVAEIKLSKPATFEADWPYVNTVPLNGEPYTTGTVHFRVENANELDVHVDLRVDKVVSVHATNLDIVDGAKITDYRVVQEAEGAQDRDCDGQPHRD